MQNKKVKVIEWGGAISEKVLVEDSGSILILTTEEEWEASFRERRPPCTVGFKREYLVVEDDSRS